MSDRKKSNDVLSSAVPRPMGTMKRAELAESGRIWRSVLGGYVRNSCFAKPAEALTNTTTFAGVFTLANNCCSPWNMPTYEAFVGGAEEPAWTSLSRNSSKLERKNPVNQSINQWRQSINQSVSQSINQSIDHTASLIWAIQLQTYSINESIDENCDGFWH